MGNACTTGSEVPNEADIEKKVTAKLERQHTETLKRERTKAKRATLKLSKEAAELQKRLAEAVGANYTPKTGIYSSQANEVDIDEYKDMSLTDYVFQNFGEFSDRTAVIDPSSGRKYTYYKLQKLVGHVAAGLYKRGFRKGDVFAIMAPNVREFPIIFYAVASLGGIITTLNPTYKESTVIHQLEDTKAKYMAVTTGTLETARKAIEKLETKSVAEIFVFGSDSFMIPKDFETKVTPFREVKGDKKPDAVKINPETDVVVIPYSSGTSGLPKGVMLTHRNVIANLVQAEASLNIRGDDVVLGLLPMFHMYGMFIFLVASLRVGATIATMKKKFDLTELLDAMQEHKVTVAHLVPPIMLAFSKAPIIDKYDISALREIVSGAAPLSNEMAHATAKRLNVTVRQGYGMTELSPVATLGVAGSDKYGSVGRLLPNTLAKIVDVDGKALGPNERGELWIKGPQAMKGYLNNEEATKSTLDADGFVHTGDVAFCDDEGDFWIVDRVKELIKYKGFQVAPAELEGVLEENEKIAAAGVIGVADEDAGEIPAAFVQLTEGAKLSEEDVMSYVADKVAGYKKVRVVHFVEEVPKSASGKILRRQLAELAKKLASGESEASEENKEDEKPATKKDEGVATPVEAAKKDEKKEEPAEKEEDKPVAAAAAAAEKAEEPATKEEAAPKKEEAAAAAPEEVKSEEDPKPEAPADDDKAKEVAAEKDGDAAAPSSEGTDKEAPAVKNGGGGEAAAAAAQGETS